MQDHYQCPSCASKHIKRSRRGLFRRMLGLFVPVEPLDCEDCRRHFNRLPQHILTVPRLAAWGSVILIGLGYVLHSTNQSATTGAGRSLPGTVSVMSEADEQRAIETARFEDRIALLEQKLTHTEVQLSMHRERAETANEKLEIYIKEKKEAENIQEALLQTEQHLLTALTRNQELQFSLEQTQTLGQQKENELQELVSKLTTELDYERALNPNLKGELARLMTDTAILESSLQNARDENELARLELTRLEQSLADIHAELDRQRAENTSVVDELTASKNFNQALELDLKEIAFENGRAQAQLNAQISELQEKLSQADRVLKDLAAAKESNAALEQDLNSVVAEKEATEIRLNALLSGLHRKLDQAEDELEKKSAEYEQSMTDMRRELEQSIGDKQMLDGEVSRMGGEIERLIASLKQGEAELDDAKEQIALLRAEVEKEPASSAIEDVNFALENWRRAWSSQQVEPYLTAYSPRFKPSGGISQEEWRERRTQRLNETESVSVTLDSVQFQSLGEDRLRASFVQRYESETYSDVANKTLVFVLEDNAWKIVSERSASRILTETIKFN